MEGFEHKKTITYYIEIKFVIVLVLEVLEELGLGFLPSVGC